MSNASFRNIAARLGVSVATVSRTFHRDSRVRPETAQRILQELKEEGYQLDPIVSAGMSRIRQRQFYRETLAWCGDQPRENLDWLEPLFQAADDFGARLGYKVDYFYFEDEKPRTLERLAAIWKARGIRGVVLGPFRDDHQNLEFPWESFAWVSIGHAVQQPVLHRVGRDYQADLRLALEWLGQQGCRRACFVQEPEVKHIFEEDMLQTALFHYHRVKSSPPAPYYELDPSSPEAFAKWVKQNRPDGVILPRYPFPKNQRVIAPLAALPTVYLSPAETAGSHLSFAARYEVIGQSSVNLMHRLLVNREFGIPTYRQSVNISSHHQTGAAAIALPRGASGSGPAPAFHGRG